MTKLIKSSFYKLFKDSTFKITLIVGAALAIFMTMLYWLLDGFDAEEFMFCNGQAMLISSLSPSQNFGLTVPINLAVMTIGEFTFGTIRNKIIAGYKKTKIYLSLLITGLVFTISLMAIYAGLCTLLATLIGGFDAHGSIGLFGSNAGDNFIWQYIVVVACVYVFITAFTIFVSTNIRNIGGTLPIVILIIVFLNLYSTVDALIYADGTERAIFDCWRFWLVPGYACGALTSIGSISLGECSFEGTTFISSVVTPLYWTAIFVLLGVLSFNKQDVK